MLLYQDRLSALVNMFALHAMVLSLSVAWQALIQHAPENRPPFAHFAEDVCPSDTDILECNVTLSPRAAFTALTCTR